MVVTPQSLPVAIDLGPGDEHESRKLFGNDASEAPMFHLKKRLPELEGGVVKLEDVESALKDLLGPGAQLLIDTIRQILHLST